MAYGDADLIRDLKTVLEMRKRSLRSVSKDIDVPYRSMQNYFSGDTKMPAAVLIALFDNLGADLHFLRNRNHQLSHFDLFDAVIQTLGDALADLNEESIGKKELGHENVAAFQKKQRLAIKFAAEISRKYSEMLEDHTFPGRRSATIGDLDERQRVRDAMIDRDRMPPSEA